MRCTSPQAILPWAQAAIGEQAYAESLGMFWTEGYTKAWRLLEKGMAQPNADFHVLHSWLALNKHQHDRAIIEAKQALKLNPNDADALEALAEALIYARQPKAGIEFAQRAMRQNPTLLGRSLYLAGLAEFALGNPNGTIQYVERTIDQTPRKKADFSGILAVAHLAKGFRVAGASAGAGGYLPLDATNRLTGSEIKSLLFGKEIKGREFWLSELSWRQQRSADGKVKRSGYPVHAGMPEAATGVDRVLKDMLCE